MSISAILAYGGQVTAIGLLIVFVGLFIIIGCIYLMSALFKMGGKAAENRARRRRNRQLRAAPPQPRPPDHGGLHNDAFPDQLLHNLRYRRTGQTRHL